MAPVRRGHLLAAYLSYVVAAFSKLVRLLLFRWREAAVDAEKSDSFASVTVTLCKQKAG